jgi:hypothetical protein
MRLCWHCFAVTSFQRIRWPSWEGIYWMRQSGGGATAGAALARPAPRRLRGQEVDNDLHRVRQMHRAACLKACELQITLNSSQ